MSANSAICRWYNPWKTLLWCFFSLIVFRCLYIFQTFSQQPIFWCHCWMLRVSFRTMAFLPTPSNFLLPMYNLRMLEWKFPCGVFTSAASSIFSFIHFATPTAYLRTYNSAYFVTWIFFFPLSWLFKICIILWCYLNAAIFLISSWLPYDSGIPRYS